MSVFDKKKVDEPEGNAVEEGEAHKVTPDEIDMKPMPPALENALEEIQSEWDIFQTRLQTLIRNLQGDVSKAVAKKSLSHAKHASMCVRDALKSLSKVVI